MSAPFQGVGFNRDPSGFPDSPRLSDNLTRFENVLAAVAQW